jgi:hypothetical protein
MTREIGSRGRDVALGLADRLELDIIHPELVERELAERMNVPESAVQHFLEGEVFRCLSAGKSIARSFLFTPHRGSP